ncbi:unnamed protein product [Phyllotreta striolata]|uniref:BPTI/Kunitz inhibitor domain-containing protein n=1 Tax=Phyllotreta striolata TaxID=444603 RepID=A0A9N9T912_PHYSR|nr:unnamed protein product [Phyllotreta striolata]
MFFKKFCIIILCLTNVISKKHIFFQQDCFQPPEEGFPCKGYFEVWTWDYRYKDCVPQTYGGCNPSKNNFHTKEKCLKVAKPICSIKSMPMKALLQPFQNYPIIYFTNNNDYIN